MANEYVVIDLETTGLDIANEEIIEIAAVKVRRGLLIDSFSTLVSCKKPLSEEISRLTGITADMLVGQPDINEALPMLAEFVGGAELVAHNADFDGNMLRKYWPDERVWLDTIVLSQIVWPSAASFSLANLTAMLDIDNQQAHRALSDALATAELFVRVEKELESLPYAAKQDILQLAAGDESPTGELLRRKCAVDNPGAAASAEEDPHRQYAKPTPRVVDEDYQLDVDKLSDYLGADSCYQERIEGFEERPQQLKMSRAVAEAMNKNGILLVEAGTGTGKSLAYLLPSALYGIGSGQQVAISTHTRNLQEQLLNKDIPMLSRLLDREVKAASVKGRSNYLCRRLYKYYLANPPENMRYFLMRVAVWRSRSSSGDGGEINVNSFDRWKWQRVCASRENCAPFCPYSRRNACIVQRVRNEAVKADILILNHSLLIANAAMDGAFLPPLPNLVIDEAQHLEHAAEDQLSARVDIYEILNLLGRLSRREKGRAVGALVQLRHFAEGLDPGVNGSSALNILNQLETNVDEVIRTAEQFFELLSAAFKGMCSGSFFPQKVRILTAQRDTAEWQLAAQMGEALSVVLEDLARNCFRLLDILVGDDNEQEQRSEELQRPPGSDELYGCGGNAREYAGTLRSCLDENDSNYVAWVEFPDDSKRPSINIVPINIGPILSERLYANTDSLIMTSATLAIGRDFSYFRRQIGLDLVEKKPYELIMSSPFHYREQALCCIANDLPDWSRCREDEAVDAISAALLKIIAASHGRAIVLFTSHYQLKAVYQQLREPLRRQGITLMAHGISGNPSTLIERLKKEDNCCILGAASFWEGVDVIGAALSLIVVVRLPFWPPNTPIAAARMERIEQSGGSAFRDYSLPQALIRFKQGFGRLIRSDRDSGVFCVLDKRIVEKYYGRSFVRSLPEMNRMVGSCDDIAEQIGRWLD